MKTMMKKLTAALLALTCIPVTGLTVSAKGTDLPWYFGTSTWDAFEGLEPFDDHGMISREDESLFLFEGTYSNGYKNKGVVVVTPRKNVMRFVLRDDVDASAATEQMAEVLDEYFPGLKDGLVTGLDGIWYGVSNCNYSVSLGQTWYDDRSFELMMPTDYFPEDAETMEAEVLLAFAKRQLISEFYGWGETADYIKEYFTYDDVLTGYEMTHYEKNDNPIGYNDTWVRVDTDWDGIQAYLAEHYPGYTVEQEEETYTSPLYRIVPTEELTLREKLELIVELHDLFGILPGYFSLEAAAQESTTGHNALEQPGDVTLDCEIDIVDVIAANKAILGASTLCKTAKKNCDINGDGTPDTTDSLAILKEVVGLTTNFAES